VKSFQYTLKKPARFSGIGLRSGKKVTIVIEPAPADSGICFVRTDVGRSVEIPCRSEFVTDTSLATTVGKDGVTVGTIEHLMAAFAGLGVDNARVLIDGPEVPAMDGSAAPFVYGIQRAGLKIQKKSKRFIKLLEPITVTSGGSSICIEPSNCLEISFMIDFAHPLIAEQQISTKISSSLFKRHIAKARTFGFLKEVEMLRQNGFALGGSLDNAIVIGDDEILNKEGLRFEDEFVRHKVLDLVGDLYLLGAPLMAKVTSVRSGHTLHHLLNQEIISRPYAWKYTTSCPSWEVPRLSPVSETAIAPACPA